MVLLHHHHSLSASKKNENKKKIKVPYHPCPLSSISPLQTYSKHQKGLRGVFFGPPFPLLLFSLIFSLLAERHFVFSSSFLSFYSFTLLQYTTTMEARHSIETYASHCTDGEPPSMHTFRSMDVDENGDCQTNIVVHDDIWRHPDFAQVVAEGHVLRVRLKYCTAASIVLLVVTLGLMGVLIHHTVLHKC